MDITKSKSNLEEAIEILVNGKEKCFCESDWNWAIRTLQIAFQNGYVLVKRR